WHGQKRAHQNYHAPAFLRLSKPSRESSSANLPCSFALEIPHIRCHPSSDFRNSLPDRFRAYSFSKPGLLLSHGKARHFHRPRVTATLAHPWFPEGRVRQLE